MKIGIFGLGAIGTLLASYIFTEHEKIYFNRSERNKLILYKDHECVFEEEIKLNKNNCDLDWLIICIKAYHYINAKDEIASLCSAHTKVLIVRNGLNHKTSLSNFNNQDNLIACLIDCSVQKYKKGYLQLSKPILTVDSKVKQIGIENIFDDHVVLTYTDDIKTATWRKLIESAALGGLMCYYDQDITVFKDLKVLNEYRLLLAEMILVSIAEGAVLDYRLIQTFIEKLPTYPDMKSTSMLTDYQSGRKIELTAKNGIIRECAMLNKIPTPINDKICKKLQAYNQFLA